MELGPLRRHSHAHSPQGRQHSAAYGPHFGPLALLDGSTCTWSASSTTPSDQGPSNAEAVRCLRCHSLARIGRLVPTEGVHGGSASVRDQHGLVPAPLAALAHRRRRRRELGAWHRPAKEDVTLGGLHFDLRALVNARSMLGTIGTWCSVHATTHTHTQATTGRAPSLPPYAPGSQRRSQQANPTAPARAATQHSSK